MADSKSNNTRFDLRSRAVSVRQMPRAKPRQAVYAAEKRPKSHAWRNPIVPGELARQLGRSIIGPVARKAIALAAIELGACVAADAAFITWPLSQGRPRDRARMQAIQRLRQLFGRYEAGRKWGKQTRELRFVWRCLCDARLIPPTLTYEGLRHHLRDPASYTIRSPVVVVKDSGLETNEPELLDERRDAIDRIANNADKARTLEAIPDNDDAAWQRAARAAARASDPWELPEPVDGETAETARKILTENGL